MNSSYNMMTYFAYVLALSSLWVTPWAHLRTVLLVCAVTIQTLPLIPGLPIWAVLVMASPITLLFIRPSNSTMKPALTVLSLALGLFLYFNYPIFQAVLVFSLTIALLIPSKLGTDHWAMTIFLLLWAVGTQLALKEETFLFLCTYVIGFGVWIMTNFRLLPLLKALNPLQKSYDYFRG